MGDGIKIKIFKVGHCVHPGFVVYPELGFKPRRFPAATALIAHPEHGNILFDTGYHERFFSVTKRFPERFYAMVTPCTLKTGESFREQLALMECRTIDSLILSHFHADHISGICDFPNVSVVCHPEEYQTCMRQNRFSGTRKGYLPTLLPPDFERQLRFISGFERDIGDILEVAGNRIGLLATDLFGDDSIYAVSLPGHTIGQIGVIVRLRHRFIFFLADACWLIDNLRKQVMPHWIANVICHDRKAYVATLHKLQRVYRAAANKVLFVPSHCQETINALVKEKWIF